MSISYLTLNLSGTSISVPSTGFTQITNNYTTVRSSSDWTNNGSGKFTYTGTSTILIVFHSTIQQTSSTNNVQLGLSLRRNGNDESNINIHGLTSNTNSTINDEISSLGYTTLSTVNNFSNSYSILVYPNDYFYAYLYNSVANTATITGFGCTINIMSNYFFIWKNPFNSSYLKISYTGVNISNVGANITSTITTIVNNGDFVVNYNGNNGQIRYIGTTPKKFMFNLKINMTNSLTNTNFTFNLRRANNQKFCFLLQSYVVVSAPLVFDASVLGYYTPSTGGPNYGIVFNPNDIYLLYGRRETGSTNGIVNIELLMVSY